MAADEEFNPLTDPEEARVLYAALDSYSQYRQAAHYNITHLRRQSFYALPSAQVELLSSPPFCLPATFNAVDRAIDANADIAEAILEAGIASFGLEAGDDSWRGHATPADLDKAQSTIRQIYRDWSAEGLPERHATFSPILRALAEYFPAQNAANRQEHHILVPGAGLGRLVFDVACAGYTVEGNEISYHQLLASNYILNCTKRTAQHRLHPWALSYSNHLSRAHQLQAVGVPDIHPGQGLDATSEEIRSELKHGKRMSMTAGDFCVLYRQPHYQSTFAAVTTCFFIDTAPNVIRYIEAIAYCLQPGGIWINNGPLLWHFESAPTPAERDHQRSRSTTRSLDEEGIGEPGSFELSNDEVVALVAHYGFNMVEQKDAPATGYIQNPRSMLQSVYRPSFWVARKTAVEAKVSTT